MSCNIKLDVKPEQLIHSHFCILHCTYCYIIICINNKCITTRKRKEYNNKLFIVSFLLTSKLDRSYCSTDLHCIHCYITIGIKNKCIRAKKRKEDNKLFIFLPLLTSELNRNYYSKDSTTEMI